MIRPGPGGAGREDSLSWARFGALEERTDKLFVGGRNCPDFSPDMIKFSLSDFYISHESWQNYTYRTFIRLHGSA